LLSCVEGGSVHPFPFDILGEQGERSKGGGPEEVRDKLVEKKGDSFLRLRYGGVRGGELDLGGQSKFKDGWYR